MIELYIRDADGHEHRRTFEEQQITIGRKRDNLVVLEHVSVSLRHALLEQRGDSWVLIDRRSTNGTLLDGRALVPDEAAVVGYRAKITIGPFELTLEADLDRTVVTQSVTGTKLTAGELLDRLTTAYAYLHDAPRDERNKQLRSLLAESRAAFRDDEQFASILSQVVAKFTPPAAAAPADGADVNEGFYKAAHQALRRLSLEVLGRPEAFAVRDDVERFVQLLATFINSTATWVVRCCAARKGIQDTFGTEVTRLGQSHGTLEGITTPQDVTVFALDWTNSGKTAEDVAAALASVFQAFVAQHAAVLKGAKAVADAVLTSLAPATIEAKAHALPSGGFRIFGTAKAQLWTAYLQEWTRLSEGGRLDDEIVRPKMKEAFHEMDAKSGAQQT